MAARGELIDLHSRHISKDFLPKSVWLPRLDHSQLEGDFGFVKLQ